MSFDTLLLICFALALVQLVVIVVKTKKHRKFLDQFKARSHADAMAQLAQIHPKDAFLIRACYALFGFEVAVATLFKTLFY